MKFMILAFFMALSSFCYGFDLNCTAQYRGPTDSEPYEVIQQKLNLNFDSLDFQILETVLFDRYFAATYDKSEDTIFLQIVNNLNTTQGQTSKGYLPQGKSAAIHSVSGEIVYSLFCQRS